MVYENTMGSLKEIIHELKTWSCPRPKCSSKFSHMANIAKVITWANHAYMTENTQKVCWGVLHLFTSMWQRPCGSDVPNKTRSHGTSSFSRIQTMLPTRISWAWICVCRNWRVIYRFKVPTTVKRKGTYWK